MKQKLLALALAVVSASAAASPIPAIPGGPLFIQFTNREQIAVAGTTGAVFGDAAEINWGVLLVSSITPGKLSILDPNVINPSGGPFFSNVGSGGQITGIFYGIHASGPATLSNPFPATAGFLDLYYRDLASFSVTDISLALPTLAGNGKRTALDKADGYTDGDFLVRLAFASGIDPNPAIFIKGTTVPSFPSFAGFATSYANVVTGLGGTLETKLDTDHFIPANNFGTRDLRFRNIYEELSDWDGCTFGGGFCLGASSSDPATGVALPEPGSMALVGLGLLGVAAIRRRRIA